MERPEYKIQIVEKFDTLSSVEIRWLHYPQVIVEYFDQGFNFFDEMFFIYINDVRLG